jgi:hypothetical protein
VVIIGCRLAGLVLVDHQNTKIRRVTTLTLASLSSKHPTAFSPVVRWSPGLARIPALSVRQPWAWLIINGLKDIENLARRTRHRVRPTFDLNRNAHDFDRETKSLPIYLRSVSTLYLLELLALQLKRYCGRISADPSWTPSVTYASTAGPPTSRMRATILAYRLPFCFLRTFKLVISRFAPS